jgi:hypothetical protein
MIQKFCSKHGELSRSGRDSLCESSARQLVTNSTSSSEGSIGRSNFREVVPSLSSATYLPRRQNNKFTTTARDGKGWLRHEAKCASTVPRGIEGEALYSPGPEGRAVAGATRGGRQKKHKKNASNEGVYYFYFWKEPGDLLPHIFKTHSNQLLQIKLGVFEIALRFKLTHSHTAVVAQT